MHEAVLKCTLGMPVSSWLMRDGWKCGGGARLLPQHLKWAVGVHGYHLTSAVPLQDSLFRDMVAPTSQPAIGSLWSNIQ